MSNRKYPKVYFKSIYIWIALCFMIGQLLFSLSVFAITNRNMLKSNYDMNQKIFRQITLNIQKSDTTIKNICSSLFINPNAGVIMNATMQEDEIYDWILSFDSFATPVMQSNPKIHSVFLYNHSMDRYFSSYRFLNYEDSSFQNFFVPGSLPPMGDYALQVSENGTEWTTIDSVIDNKCNTIERVLEAPVTSRYFRILCTFPMFQPAAGWTEPAGFARLNQVELFTAPEPLLLSVASVESFSEINTACGTAFEALALPAQARVTLSNNLVTDVPVTWLAGDYNENVPAQYTLYGTLGLPSLIQNQENKMAAITVLVQQSTAKYPVTVVNGIGSGEFEAGATVLISANAAPQGQVFEKWISDEVTFENPNAANTSFVMPDKAVKATAIFRANSPSVSDDIPAGVPDTKTDKVVHTAKKPQKKAELALTEPETGVCVSGMITKGASLQIALKEASDYTAMQLSFGEADILGTYDVSLINGTFEDTLELTFPVDQAYNGKTITVKHQLKNGDIDTMNAICTDGKIIVKVTELSPFMLGVQKASEPASEQPVVSSSSEAQSASVSPAPSRGNIVPIVLLLLLLLAALATVIAIIISRKKQK